MSLRNALPLVCLAFFGGCADAPPPAPAAPASRPAQAKASRLRRFTFPDRPSNRETGGTLPEAATPADEDALVGPDGKPVRLSRYRGRPLVLVFLRGFVGYICPYCTTYTAQLATRYEELRAAGAEVVVVYPTREDDAERVQEFVAACDEILAEEGEDALPFTVLLDAGTKVVRRYNLEWELARPSTFVLDAEGRVRYAYVGRSTEDRPSVDRVLAEVRELNGGAGAR